VQVLHKRERCSISIARARCYQSDGFARICEPDKLTNMPTGTWSRFVERPVVD